jgi:hypothetical protein
MRKDGKSAISVPCPDCEQPIYLSLTPKKGQSVTCPNCWAYLRVVSLEPLELNWDIEEYWEDDWETAEEDQTTTE